MSRPFMLRRAITSARRGATGGGTFSDWSAPLLVYTGCSTVQASGTGISQYQSLSGADFDNQVNAAPIGNVVSLAAGTFSFSDFTTVLGGVTSGAGITRLGLRGVGATTILQMTASTSTHAADIPVQGSGQTNQYYLLYFDHDNLDLGCLTVQGTVQGTVDATHPNGHLYNGIRLQNVDNGHLYNIKMLGAGVGDNIVPPGETFALATFQTTNMLYENCEVDGRRDGATGLGVTASGFGENSYVGATYKDCYAHHCQYNAGWALWQGTGVTELIRCRSDANRISYNVERVGRELVGLGTGTINMRDCYFGNYLSGGAHFYLGNDQGSTHLNIYDPVLAPGLSKILIFISTAEQGNPQKQLRSDVHVYQNGVDVSASMLQWTGSGAGLP